MHKIKCLYVQGDSGLGQVTAMERVLSMRSAAWRKGQVSLIECDTGNQASMGDQERPP